MNKILLPLLLLTTLNFYSQVTDIVHCAGDTAFDLTGQDSLLIGNLNPAETTVSFHLTQDDATNGANAISNPTNFISTADSKTIYSRINHLGDITTNYFSLIVNPVLVLDSGIKPINCLNEKATIFLTGLGGKAPFLYSSDNGVTYSSTFSFQEIVAGTYVYYIKDTSGCIASKSITIDPLSPISMSYTKTNVNCFGRDTGVIMIDSKGGTTPYTYSLLNSTGTVKNTIKQITYKNF